MTKEFTKPDAQKFIKNTFYKVFHKIGTMEVKSEENLFCTNVTPRGVYFEDIDGERFRFKKHIERYIDPITKMHKGFEWCVSDKDSGPQEILYSRNPVM